MDGRISIYVLLVFVWCSLDAGGLLMVVTAPPTVSAMILTPEADRKEGGQVDMRCNATNLLSDHIVEWRLCNKTLRWNDTSIAANVRFMFDTTYPRTGVTIQDLTITDLQIDDYNEYICNIKEPLSSGGSLIVATSSVILSPPSFPICSPDGPITVYAGTELHMRCLSDENDNPAAIIRIFPTTNSGSYTWTSLSDSDNVIWSLDLTVDVGDDDVAFNCIIPTGNTCMTRSCTIGPINVAVTMQSQPTTLVTTDNNIDQAAPCNCSPWIVSFVVAIVIFVVSLIFIIICTFQNIKLRCLVKRLESKNTSEITKPDPYMELQPTEDKNTVYMEPSAKETTTAQDTYYQPVEIEDGSPEYDYAQPEGSTEATRISQSTAERQYQNINN